MVEEAARDYAEYFCKINLTKELKPLNTSIEEMLARIEEFQCLLSTVKATSNETMYNHLPEILKYSNEYNILFKRIDDLEKFIHVANESVDRMEKIVEISEEELDIPNYSIKGLLRPFLSKSKLKSNNRTNLVEGEFQKPELFKTSDYFVPEGFQT